MGENRKGHEGFILKYTDDFIENLADELLAWMTVPSNFWLGVFAVEHKMDTKQLERFRDKNQKFAQAYAIAKQQQTNKLLVGGLAGKLNPFLTWCALKNVSGWRDKTETEHSGDVNFNLKSLIQDVNRAEKTNNQGMARLSHN